MAGILWLSPPRLGLAIWLVAASAAAVNRDVLATRQNQLEKRSESPIARIVVDPSDTVMANATTPTPAVAETSGEVEGVGFDGSLSQLKHKVPLESVASSPHFVDIKPMSSSASTAAIVQAGSELGSAGALTMKAVKTEKQVGGIPTSFAAIAGLDAAARSAFWDKISETGKAFDAARYAFWEAHGKQRIIVCSIALSFLIVLPCAWLLYQRYWSVKYGSFDQARPSRRSASGSADRIRNTDDIDDSLHSVRSRARVLE